MVFDVKIDQKLKKDKKMTVLSIYFQKSVKTAICYHNLEYENTRKYLVRYAKLLKI